MGGPIGRGMWALATVMAASVCFASACELKPPNAQSPSPSRAVTPTPSPQPAPLAITAPSFHSGEVTVAYAPVALAATGGTPPYTWTIGAGALPGGLTLSPDGGVTGTPSGAGSFDFTAHAADTGGRTADQPASISVVAAPTASLTAGCAKFCAVEQGCDTSCGAFGTVSGGTAPYSYALQGGYVPHGVSLSGLALAGTFTDPAKYWQFTVLVTDSLGASAAISPIFYVYPHISISGTAICKGNFGTPCQATMPYSGGAPNASLTVTVASWGAYCPPNFSVCPPAPAGPPGGFSVSASGGTLTVSVPARCGGSCRSGYTGAATLFLTDESQCTATTKCTSGYAQVDVYIVGG